MAKTSSTAARKTVPALHAYPQFTTLQTAKWLDSSLVTDPTFQLFGALDDRGRAGRAVIMEFTADEVVQLYAQLGEFLARCGERLLDGGDDDISDGGEHE